MTTGSSVVRVLLTMEETAEMLGICTKTLRAHVAAGDIRYVLVGKRTRKFTQSDINAFIEDRRECHSTDRKSLRTGTTTSRSKVYDFMAQRERRIEERRSRSKPKNA